MTFSVLILIHKDNFVKRLLKTESGRVLAGIAKSFKKCFCAEDRKKIWKAQYRSLYATKEATKQFTLSKEINYTDFSSNKQLRSS